ncbi:MAG: tRNA uridine-5-carboxymethylaminomethyl(34) synthesis GTPase MnmE [Myxococcota bacterium]|nr:tRNA uridine-5-carboxymethylaminomethyl(34) synthesis GTPase MnmE [Myxococcota bacterium]
MHSSETIKGAAGLLSDEPIVAISTPPGRGAIGLVRLSGPSASLDSILKQVVEGSSGSSVPDRQAQLVVLVDPESRERIDQGILVRFAAPRSYTGEDVAELSLHGSPVVLDAALSALRRAGARLAQPGEFTRRAVLNGKMNLVEAEAVEALISAEDEAAARLARRHLGGELCGRIQEWRGELLAAAAAVEALVDFPEEVEAQEVEEQLQSLPTRRAEIEALGHSFHAGRRVVQGWRLALVGPVNAGKSTLFNLLLDWDRAIVSPQPGTTRDVVSETVDWDGVALRIEDTAGFRDARDSVEREGIERSGSAVRQADLVLNVRDARLLVGEQGLSEVKEIEGSGQLSLAVATHSDLLGEQELDRLVAEGWHLVAAPSARGIAALRSAILAEVHRSSPRDELMVHTARQHRGLMEAANHLAEAVNHGLHEPALMAVAISTAARVLHELVEPWDNEELLDEVFARFCIGK